MTNGMYLDLSVIEGLRQDAIPHEQIHQASRYSGDVIGGVIEGGVDIASVAMTSGRTSALADTISYIGNTAGNGAGSVAEAGGTLAGTAAEAGGAILSCIGEACGAVLGCVLEFLCACICGIFDGL